jgi:mRNA interferase RelE/StbE
MNVHFTERARIQYTQAPTKIRRAFDRKLAFLAANLRHPSLRAKKYNEAGDIWQARITKGWRFYFEIDDNTYTILSITVHPK